MRLVWPSKFHYSSQGILVSFPYQASVPLPDNLMQASTGMGTINECRTHPETTQTLTSCNWAYSRPLSSVWFVVDNLWEGMLWSRILYSFSLSPPSPYTTTNRQYAIIHCHYPVSCDLIRRTVHLSKINMAHRFQADIKDTLFSWCVCS